MNVKYNADDESGHFLCVSFFTLLTQMHVIYDVNDESKPLLWMSFITWSRPDSDACQIQRRRWIRALRMGKCLYRESLRCVKNTM